MTGLRGLFLNALRFSVAVIFGGPDRTLTVSRGGLPNRAPAFTSLCLVCDRLFMSVPSGSLVTNSCISHCTHECAGVWSLETFGLPKAAHSARFGVIKIDQTFFYRPCKLSALSRGCVSELRPM